MAKVSGKSSSKSSNGAASNVSGSARPVVTTQQLEVRFMNALQQGNWATAIPLLEGAVAMRPTHAPYQFLLGRAYKATGALDRAIAAYRRAVTLDARHAEAWVSLGIALKGQGKLDEAVAAYQQALRVRPNMPEALANLGVALELQRLTALPDSAGPGEDALAAQRRAAELNPRNADILNNLGALLLRANQLEDALRALNDALGLAPARADICANLYDALTEYGDPFSARTCVEKWLGLNAPTYEIDWKYAHALFETSDFDQCLVQCDQMLLRYPDKADILDMKLYAAARSAKAGALEAAFAQTAERRSGAERWSGGSLLALNYMSDNAAEICTAHRLHGQHYYPPATASVARKAAQDGRIRIAYLSGDFCRHSVAYFMEPLLEHHDRQRFSITCYALGPRRDDVTERLRAKSDHFIECALWSDAALAERIHRDGIDILVDLSGHTTYNRLRLMPQRVAPVQVTYLGYPTTVGVPGLDYRLTDWVIDPAGSEAINVEAPLRLAHSMFCYRTDDHGDPAHSAPEAPVTFGSFNNLAKMSRNTIHHWAAVLQSVPSSRMLLKAHGLDKAYTADNIRATFAEAGIAAERLQLVSWMPNLSSHLDIYRSVDIALDAYPYNGATTTCEALWMGVPVVTLSGSTHAARMGASILAAAGFSDWVAGTPGQFTHIASDLAQNYLALRQTRLARRAQMQASPLMDAARFTANLEQVLAAALAAVPVATPA